MATTFVNEPMVPIALTVRGGRRYTLYQPGWTTVDDGSQAFLGENGRVYGFDSLDELAGYVRSSARNSLSPSPYFQNAKDWTRRDYSDRLCVYDLGHPPELADGQLDEYEQRSLGSTLALMLDLLEYSGIDDPHANALLDDDEIGRLAGGDLLGVFGSTKRRAVVNVLNEHWSWCVAAVSQRFASPRPDAAVDTDGETPLLESVADAVTMWLGFAEVGAYTLRTTVLDHNGLPAYPAGAYGKLQVWDEPEAMARDLSDGRIAQLGPVDLSAAVRGREVNCRPDDDLIFDLYDLGQAITPALDAEQAGALGEAWIELSRLAAWGNWHDVAARTAPTSPVGAFVLGCASDLARSGPGAERALASADTVAVQKAWNSLLEAVQAHLDT